MIDSSKRADDRSIHIGGNASGNILQTGDHNTASIRFQHATLPPPESVDIRAELTALQRILTQLQSPDRTKIERALADADDEVAKPQPDRDKVGKALARALDYAQKAEGFAKVIQTLTPHVVNVASWLGSQWHKLLAVVGMVD